VTRAIRGLFFEGALGAVLTGLMVLLFLRDWRSSLVVVLKIPLAILASVTALWVSGQTINIMTLGGLALAVGVLVDEATVTIENIHTHLADGRSLARAASEATAETTLPRFLAMLCILAVFIPAFFMTGAAHNLFVPLALAVGFSMGGVISAFQYVCAGTLGLDAAQSEHAPQAQRDVLAQSFSWSAGRSAPRFSRWWTPGNSNCTCEPRLPHLICYFTASLAMPSSSRSTSASAAFEASEPCSGGDR
jgi:hypothetical protein